MSNPLKHTRLVPAPLPLVAGLLWTFVSACGTGLAPPPPATGDLRRVAEELYLSSPFYGRSERESLEERLENPILSRSERLQLSIALAVEYLEAGEMERALELAEANHAEAGAGDPRLARVALRDLALTWLREAENRNCIARHNADCCIVSASEGALHTERQPAERARSLYQAMLAVTPDNLNARWLVSLTTLLLGESLDDLPQGQRIPVEAFGKSVPEPLFRDVAIEVGVDAASLAGGVAVEDYDGDGWLDILTSTCDPAGSLNYFQNLGHGRFEERTEAAGLSEQLGGLNLLAGDVDADGDQDVLVLRGGWLREQGSIRRSLLRNDGKANFEDVTASAGLMAPAHPSQTAAFGDFDGDGSLDLYVGNESRVELEGPTVGVHPSQLFRNDGRASFVDVAAEAGVENNRYAKGVAVGDPDDDGDLDLYVSNIGFNRLYQNDGEGRFEDVALQAGVGEPAARSFASWFFDYDQDGRQDLWVNAYSGSIGDLAADALGLPYDGVAPCLYRNLGAGRFVDVAKEVGLDHPWLTMGANFGDVDGDGWLDVYLGTGDPRLQSLMPNVLLRNVEGKRFADETGLHGLGHLQKGHGIAFADFDGDGDQDLFHKLGGFVPVDLYANVLFENRSTNGHRWLVLSLEGTRSNRDAVGARLQVHLDTPAGPRVLYRAVGSVSSFGGSPHRQELGLGDATRIERLEIRWPGSAEPQVLSDVPLDAWLVIREGEERFEKREWRSFEF